MARDERSTHKSAHPSVLLKRKRHFVELSGALSCPEVVDTYISGAISIKYGTTGRYVSC